MEGERMALIFLPMFMPLLLVGWVLDADGPWRERSQRRQLRAFFRTWMPLHGSVEELGALREGAPRR